MTKKNAKPAGKKALDSPKKAKQQRPVADLAELLPLDHLALFSTKCKRCGYLDPDEKKKYTSCHHSKGNALCPAAEVRIVVVGQATAYAQQVQKARDDRNPQQEAKLMAYVSKQNIAFQSKFYSALENKE